jgi:hypothetical protein
LAGRIRRRLSRYLMSLKEGHDESLKDYIMRFNQEKLAIESSIEEFIFVALF